MELLGKTSTLIKVFQDQRPVRSLQDMRLSQLEQVLDWFVDWKAEVKGRNNFITQECFEDLVCLLVGFQKLVQMKIASSPLGYIKPSLVNSDVVENLFCSQRGICKREYNKSHIFAVH